MENANPFEKAMFFNYLRSQFLQNYCSGVLPMGQFQLQTVNSFHSPMLYNLNSSYNNNFMVNLATNALNNGKIINNFQTNSPNPLNMFFQNDFNLFQNMLLNESLRYEMLQTNPDRRPLHPSQSPQPKGPNNPQHRTS